MSKYSPRFSILALLAVISVPVLIAVAVIWAFFMHTVTVEPGHHAVIVDKPYFFGNEGVRKEPLREGRILLFRTTTADIVRVTPQSISVKVDDFSSSDNILLDFESTIQYRVTDAVRLINDFGNGWFDNNIRQQYLAVVRESVKKRTMTAMMSDPVAAQQVDDEVTSGLKRLVEVSKLPVEVLGVSLGRARPNESVLAQMNETAAQQQRRKTLVEATAAEREREKEQIAKAQADNAYRNAMQLTPQMFIELERIKRNAEACMAQGNICIIGNTTGASVPIQVAK